MTKSELVSAVQSGCSCGCELSKKNVEEIINCLFGVIAKDIKKSKRFAYPGFGIFKVRKRSARKGRNPQTGEEIKIKASKTVGFKPASTLKESL